MSAPRKPPAAARGAADKKPVVPAVPNYITPTGFRRLLEEAHDLRILQRPKVVQEVSEAAAQGDRSENASYIYGKKKLREIDRRLEWLGKRIDAAQVVEIKAQPGKEDRVFFGATVTLEDQDGEAIVYQLVGVDEIDLPSGRISWRSPVGNACLGKQVDDDVRVTTPAGVRRFTITEVEYK